MKLATEKYEHASMILTGLENDKSIKDKESKEKTSNKLDKVYMSLIDLYLLIGRDRDSKQLLSLLEQRLEKISLSQEYAYRMMNELANLIRDHGHD